MRVKISDKELKEAAGGLLQALGWFTGATAVLCMVLLLLDAMDTDLELWEAALRMALLLAGSVAAVVLGRKLYPPKKKKAKQAPQSAQTAPQNCCARCGVDLKLLKAAQKGKGADGRLYCDVCLQARQQERTDICGECGKTFPTTRLIRIQGRLWCRECWETYVKQGGSRMNFMDVKDGKAAGWMDGSTCRYAKLTRKGEAYRLLTVRSGETGGKQESLELTAGQVKDEASFRAAVGEKIANRGVTDVFWAFIHSRQLHRKQEGLEKLARERGTPLFDSKDEYCQEEGIAYQRTDTVMLCDDGRLLLRQFSAAHDTAASHIGATVDTPLLIFKPLNFDDLPELINTSKDPKAAKYKGMTAQNWREYLPGAPEKAEAPKPAPRKRPAKPAPKPAAPRKQSPKVETVRLFEACRREDMDERQFVHQSVDTVILTGSGELFLEEHSCVYDAHNCARVFGSSTTRNALEFSDLPGLIAKSRDPKAEQYKGMNKNNWWQLVPGWEKYAPAPRAAAPRQSPQKHTGSEAMRPGGGSEHSEEARFFTWLCNVTPKRELEWGQSEYYALDTRNGTPYYIKEQYDGRVVAHTWYLDKKTVTWEEVKQQLEEGDPQRRSELEGIGPGNWKEKLFRTYSDENSISIDCNPMHGYARAGVRWQEGKRVLFCESGRDQMDPSAGTKTRELTEEMCLSLREFRKAAESFVTRDYVIRRLWVWVITHCQEPGKRLIQTDKCYGGGFYEHACAYRDETDGKGYFCHFEAIPAGRADEILGFHACRISETEYEKLKADETYRVKKGRYLGVAHGQDDLCRWILAKALRENRCFVWTNFGSIDAVCETCHLTWSPEGMSIPGELMKQGFPTGKDLEDYIHQLDHVVARRTCSGNRNYDHAVEYVYGKDSRLYYCYLSEIPDRNSSIGWEVDEITAFDFEQLAADRSHKCSPVRHLGMIPDIYMGNMDSNVGTRVLTKALTEFRSFQWKSTGFRKWEEEPAWLDCNYPPVGTVIDLGKGEWTGKAERGEATAVLRRTYPGWHLRLEMLYFNLYAEQPKGEPSLKEQDLPLDITPEKLSDLIFSISAVRFPPRELAQRLYIVRDPKLGGDLNRLKSLILSRAEELFRNPHTESYRRLDRDAFHGYVARLNSTEVSDGDFLIINDKGLCTWAAMERGQGNAVVQSADPEEFAEEFLKLHFFSNCAIVINGHYCGMIRKDGELYLADYCSSLLVKGSLREAEAVMRKWLTYPVTFCGWGEQGAAFRINREALREEEPTLCCWCDDDWLEHDPEPCLENVLRYSSGIAAARVEKRRCTDGKERVCLMLRLKENSVRETVRIEGKAVPARELGGYVFVLPRCGEFRVWIGEVLGSRIHPLYEDDFCMK